MLPSFQQITGRFLMASQVLYQNSPLGISNIVWPSLEVQSEFGMVIPCEQIIQTFTDDIMPLAVSPGVFSVNYHVIVMYYGSKLWLTDAIIESLVKIEMISIIKNDQMWWTG